MNVIDIVRQKGINPRRVSSNKGGEYHSMCPLCGDGGKGSRSDRFHVWPEQKEGLGSWWCRQCSRGGDIVSLVMAIDGISYREACASLDIDIPASHGVPLRPRVNSRRTKPDFSPSAYQEPQSAWREHAGKFIAWAHERLVEDHAEVMQWLASRGIDPGTAIRWQLGWNPGRNGKDLFRAREAWGLETLKKEDGSKKKLWLPRGLVIPYHVDGILKRVRIRRPKAHLRNENDSRYYVVPGGSGVPFLIGEKRRAYVVVETELDGLLIDQEAVDLCGVVAMGSSSNMPDEISHAHLSNALCILNALDFDAAGGKSWPKWKSTYSQARRWPVPRGKDPGDAYKAGVDIRAWVLSGLPPAWHVRPTPFAREKAQGVVVASGPPAAESDTADRACQRHGTADDAVTSDAVNELGDLLRRYPVRIVNTVKRTGIEVPCTLKNDQVSKRISDLVFGDAACRQYLEAHADEIIDGRNFYHG